MTQPTNLAALRSQQPAKKSMKEIAELPKQKQFPAMLETLQNEIRRALPTHLNPDRMARIALTCFRTTPKLALCEPASVFAAVLQASQLGLEPGLLGQCYLIPYKDQCTLQIGYQGLVDLARRSGRIVSLSAHCVYTNDRFELSYGLTERLEHTPALDGPRGDFRLAYAVAHLKDGGTVVEVMTREEIERIRDRSQNVQSAKRFGKQTPWDTDFGEMARKTVLRRITKFLPKSVELATAIALDETASMNRAQNLNIDDAIEGTWSPVEQLEHEGPPEGMDPETGEDLTRAGTPSAPAAEPSAPPSPSAPAEAGDGGQSQPKPQQQRAARPRGSAPIDNLE